MDQESLKSAVGKSVLQDAMRYRYVSVCARTSVYTYRDTHQKKGKWGDGRNKYLKERLPPELEKAKKRQRKQAGPLGTHVCACPNVCACLRVCLAGVGA